MKSAKPSRAKRGPATPGALVDRNPEDASKTAKKAAQALWNETVGSIALSAVAGYVDTSGFLALFGLFTAHVTGDLVTAAASMAEGLHSGAWVKLAMVPIFMAVVCSITLFARRIGKRGAETLAPLLGLMTLALAAFLAAGIFAAPYAKSADSWGVALIGGLGVAAMGVQNALMKGALKSFSQTTLMTGNLTQFTIDLTECLFPPALADPRERRRIRKDAARAARKTGFPLLAFMCGSALGALGTKMYGLRSIALPTLVVGVLAIAAAVRSRRRRRRACADQG
jgi:uncharacterized membrane protein YoaK (UPF0700 family)